MSSIEYDKSNHETPSSRYVERWHVTPVSRTVERWADFKTGLTEFENKVASVDFGTPHPKLRKEATKLGQSLPVRLEPDRCDLLFIALPKLSEGPSTDKGTLFTDLGVIIPHGFYGITERLYSERVDEPLDIFNRSFEYYRDIKRRNGSSEEELSNITAWQTELYKEFVEYLPTLGVTLH